MLIGAALLPLGVLLRPSASPPRCVASLTAATPVAEWGDLTDKVLRLTDAQQARTVASVCVRGTLSTELDVPGAEGAVFSSDEIFVLDADGSATIALASEQALSNLGTSSKATFHISAPRGGAAAGSSVSLIGVVEETSVDDISDADLEKLSKASGASVQDIAARPWRQLVPSSVHLSDTIRNREAWVPASEYAEATANPLANAAEALLKKMNGAHASSLARFASVYAGLPEDKVTSAELLGVDQLGFDLRVEQVALPPSLMRVGFRLPPANQEEGVSVFMKLFQEAYERQQGWM